MMNLGPSSKTRSEAYWLHWSTACLDVLRWECLSFRDLSKRIRLAGSGELDDAINQLRFGLDFDRRPCQIRTT
jgi:hypothetical protein